MSKSKASSSREAKAAAPQPVAPTSSGGNTVPTGATIPAGATETTEAQSNPEVLRAQAEYEQIAAALAPSRIASASEPLLTPCAEDAVWCLPDLNCRARSPEVGHAIKENRGCAGDPVL